MTELGTVKDGIIEYTWCLEYVIYKTWLIILLKLN